MNSNDSGNGARSAELCNDASSWVHADHSSDYRYEIKPERSDFRHRRHVALSATFRGMNHSIYKPAPMSEWVRAAIDHKKVSQAELARQLTKRLRVDYDRSKVNKMTLGTRDLSADEMLAIAEITGYPAPNDLAVDSRTVVPVDQEFGPERDNLAPILEADKPFPDAVAQMVGRIGGGSTGAVITIDVGEMQSREEVGEWWRIPPAILRGLARADVSSTVGFAMDGDSMEPTIQRTDIVFIDTNRQKVEPDGIWAIDYGLGRTLKRVAVRRRDGEIFYVIKSDNKAYPDEEYSEHEVTIFGRYVGRFSVF